MSWKNLTFVIPKWYKGIISDITLKLNSKLGVITGLNWSGKTTLLKYIYEQYKNKQDVFFKTQKIDYLDNDRYQRRGRHNYNNSYNNVSFDELYEKILDMFKRFNKEPYTHYHEVFAMLFDTNSTLYDQWYDFLEKLADGVLAEFDEPNNVKKRLGIPLEEDITKSLISAINKEIKEGVEYPYKKGKEVYNQYLNKNLDAQLITKVNELKQTTIDLLRKKYREKSSIKDRSSFEAYLYELVSNNPFSVESVVQQLSRRIYEDAKAKSSRTKTKKIWQELNDELKKYRDKNQFNYELVAPSIYSSNYEVTFLSSNGKEVHFDFLSSGEKIIFELICYYFLSWSNNKKPKIVILDEFDANLNPTLAEMYIDVVNEQFCKKWITTLLTTHSPSTVVEVNPKDLFFVSIKDNVQSIRCAENEFGKKELLQKLAPKFVYYGEFWVLEYLLTDRKNVIVFTEGKNDCENFGLLKDKYTFIQCWGAGNIKNFMQCIKAIPFLNKAISGKIVIALFDFDKEWRESIQKLLESDWPVNDQFAQQITNREDLFIQYPGTNNIFLAMMTPSKSSGYDYEKDCYRHQELKKEGEEGVTRQGSLIQKIIQFSKESFNSA